MKKGVTIELLGDRAGIESNIESPELLVNSNFTSGATGSSQFDPSNNALPGWDLDCGNWSNATRQFTWNSSGWLQKTAFAFSSRFRQVMTLGAGVAYTATIRFSEWTRSGTIGLVDQGMAPPGVAANIGANVIFADPSNQAPYGLGVGSGSNPNLNVGFGGGRAGGLGAGGIGTSDQPGTWHEATVVWRQANNYTTNALTLQMDGNSLVTIDWIRLSRVDMNQSLIVGTLDGANPEDSPLSLNYAINSATNIEARAGSYSKTFQIPATANNNQVLKRMNIAGSTHNNAGLRFQTPCRISMGGVFAVEGLFKVQDVTRIKDKAVSYSCVFFGDNLGWSTLLENKFLYEVDFPNSTLLKVGAKEIITTWEQDDATQVTEYDGTVSENTSPIVYPFATYGPTNETGGLQADVSMQLLKQYWEYHTSTVPSSKTGCYFYGTAHMTDTTPLPVVDWKPMLWIYPMIHTIFNSIGYRIVSSFIETNEFKRLLYATPNANYNNPDERYVTYSNTNDFNSTAVLSNANLIFSETNGTQGISYTWPDPITNDGASGYFQYTGTAAEPIVWNSAQRFNNILDNTTAITHGANYTYITIGEAGYYHLELKGLCFGFSGATWSGAGGNNATFFFGPGIGWQVQSVGNTSWNEVILLMGAVSTNNGFVKNQGQTGANYIIDTDDSTFDGYFNKGDKLRLFVRVEWNLDGDGLVGTTGGPTTSVTGCTWRMYGTSLNGLSTGLATSSDGIINVTLINPSRLEYAQTYNLTDIIPKEQKQLEFIKGIAHAFNLQFQTDENTKTVYIEPFSEFYKFPNEAIDWTSKLDRSKEVVDSWIDSNFTRRLIFKYKTDDEDAMIEELAGTYFDGVEDNYPYIEYLNEAYPVGDTIFENPFFSGTYDVQKFTAGGITAGNSNFYSAALWTTVGGTEAKGFGFAPRLLLYEKKDYGIQGITNMDGDYINFNYHRNWVGQFWEDSDSDDYWQAWVGWPDTTQFIGTGQAPIYNASPPPFEPFSFKWAHAFLPQCTFINRYEFTNQFGLSYGNYECQDYAFDTTTVAYGSQTYGPMGIGEGLYHRYYKSMIDNLIQQPKLRTCYIDLKVSDILNLDFSKPIYIDGLYYKLIKVVDYQPHFNASTEVELHQYTPEKGAGIPQAPASISINSIAGGTFNINQAAPAPTTWPY